MKIAVCDDCHEDAAHLKSFLEGQDVRLYENAGQLLADMEEHNIHFDLYLLDIYMDDSTGGIELAERIRSGDEEAVICFVSTSDAFYREAYDLYAVQYLLKPVQETDVKRLLERLTQRKSGKTTSGWAINGGARQDLSPMVKFSLSTAGSTRSLSIVWTEPYRSARASWTIWKYRCAVRCFSGVIRALLSTCTMWTDWRGTSF